MHRITRFWDRLVSPGGYLMALREKMRRDDGYSTEAVIVTALMAGLALAAVGVIVAKVMGRAGNIDLG